MAPPWYPLPPRGYGGTELVVHLLQTELRAMGHEVVVFGAEGSGAGVTALGEMSWSRDLGGADETARIATYLARVYDRLSGERFDVLHDHSCLAGLVLALHSGVAPVVVHTIHGEFLEALCTFYSAVQERARLCAISESQAATAPRVRIAAVVPNAVDAPSAPPSRTRERYLIEVARITPDKGQHLAIQVARRSGRKLILAGKVERTGAGERYFEDEVEPHLGRAVEYYPNVAGAEKARLISRAAAGIFPLQWPEPFGLAMAECMVVGTPILALRTGSAPELIDDGVTGFLADDVEGLVQAAARLDQIDPIRCAEVSRKRFSPRLMAERYLQVYTGGATGERLSASAALPSRTPAEPRPLPSGR